MVDAASHKTLQGVNIEQVQVDSQLSLKCHVETLVKKLKLKLGSYHRNKACFSVEAQKRPFDSTLYDEDLLNMPEFTHVTQPLAHIYFQVHSWFTSLLYSVCFHLAQRWQLFPTLV